MIELNNMFISLSNRVQQLFVRNTIIVIIMRNYASAVRGENDRPNTSRHKQATPMWTLVRPAKKTLSLSVSTLMNVASKNNALRTSLQVIKHTTKSHQRSKKPPLSAKDVDTHLLRLRADTLYSVDELKAMKRRAVNLKASSYPHVLFSNLELDHAKLLQEACLSIGSMLRKKLQTFKYSDSFTVTLEKGGKKMYTIVLQLSQQLDRYQDTKLKDIFAKHKCEGFVPWLSGKTGWYFSPGANEWGKSIISRLNDLQGVVRAFAPPELLYGFPGESKLLIWCKRQDLWRCVNDVRFFVERAKTKLPDTSHARRLKRCLLLNSDDGPDSLVHWAHHDPQNNYPLTVVTEASMRRLVELLVDLLRQVLPRDAEEKLNGILNRMERL